MLDVDINRRRGETLAGNPVRDWSEPTGRARPGHSAQLIYADRLPIGEGSGKAFACSGAQIQVLEEAELLGGCR